MECGGAYAKGVNVTDSPENKKVKQSGGRVLFRLIFGRTMITVLLFAVADTVSYRDFPDGGSVRESAHDQ